MAWYPRLNRGASQVAAANALTERERSLAPRRVRPIIREAMLKSLSDTERSCRTVVVVHGLWMTGAVFALLRLRLARFGYRVAAFSYPSTRLTLDEIASRLARFVAVLGAARVDLVGHSLGGLAVLHMLAAEFQAPAGRVVLLGAPVAGSRAAARI